MNSVFENKSPVIRFKEFEKGWTFESLDCVASKVSKKNINLNEERVLTNSAKFGIVFQQNFFDKEIGKLENLTGYYKVEINDFIYNPRISRYASAGPINRNKLSEGVVSPLYTVFRFYEGNLDFLEQYFKSTKWHRHIKKIANYGARFDRMNITIRDLFTLPIPIIEEQEQQKIASFLSKVDTRIEQLEKKKSLFEQYKKGLMQKIFSQEIRFKDDQGKEYPEWEVISLKQVGETYGGLSGKSKDDFGDGKQYVQYLQVFENSRVKLENCGLVRISESEKQHRVCKGDVLFTVSSETRDEVGVSSVVLDETDELYLNSFCFGLRLNLNKLSPDFARYLFRNQEFRRKIVRLSQGSTRFNLSKKAVMEISEFVPHHDEQQKIANFLSSIDRKIELISGQISQTRDFKLGLLQQMFV